MKEIIAGIVKYLFNKQILKEIGNEGVLQKLIDHRNNLKRLNSTTRLVNAYIANLV